MNVPQHRLSHKQREVLRWVQQGCPDGVFEGFAHRVSARALHHQGLLHVQGHGESWSATLTEEGAADLEKSDHHDAEMTIDTSLLPQEDEGTSLAPRRKSAQRSSVCPTGAVQKKKKPRVVEQMMTALQEAEGHRLVISHEQRNRYQLRAAAAEREGRIPHGMQIMIRHGEDNETVIVALEPLPAWRTAVLEPITVPTHLRDPTEVTAKLSQSTTFEVHGPPRDRALRLVEALVTAARAREWKVSAFLGQLVNQTRPHRGSVRRDGIEIRVERDIFRLWFTQDVVRTPHEPTPRELSRARHGYLFPDVDEIPADHLGLVLDGEGRTLWASQWKDTEDHQLEDDLAQVLEEIRLRHEDLLERRHQEEQRAVIRHREHEEHLAAARVRYEDDFLIRAMHTQAQQWEQATLLRGYARAVREQAELLDGVEREQSVAWADQIDAQAVACDPLGMAGQPPHVPAPSHADLQPFLPRERFPRW